MPPKKVLWKRNTQKMDEEIAKEEGMKSLQFHLPTLAWGQSLPSHASRWGREAAGLSRAPLLLGQPGPVNLPSSSSSSLMPCWPASQRALKEYGKKWGKRAQPGGFQNKTCKEKPATTDLVYSILLV